MYQPSLPKLCYSCLYGRRPRLENVSSKASGLKVVLMQEHLEVSAEQEHNLLEARRRLLKAVTQIRQERERIVLELGLALLQKQAASFLNMITEILQVCMTNRSSELPSPGSYI